MLTDIFYICRKQIGVDDARTAVGMCLSHFTILAIDRSVAEAAYTLSGTDFEGNIQIACAIQAGLDLIVTRDPTGCAHSPIPAAAPPDVLGHLPMP